MALVLHPPWDAGQGELAKFLPALRSRGSPCELKESGRVTSASLSSQARGKVTTVPGWGLHRATCVHHGKRTGTGCCSPALQEQHPQLLGADSDAMLCPLPIPCPWICSQSPLSMPISRQYFPPELLGVQHLG